MVKFDFKDSQSPHNISKNVNYFELTTEDFNCESIQEKKGK